MMSLPAVATRPVASSTTVGHNGLVISTASEHRRIQQRAKQVFFGKDTDGYRNYLYLVHKPDPCRVGPVTVPRDCRDPSRPQEHPMAWARANPMRSSPLGLLTS